MARKGACYLMIGQMLGHYRISAKIGAGGMGEVYRAHDQQLKREVALKILPVRPPGDAQGGRDLICEAQAASALNDPHICIIYEVGEADGRAFIAMELVEGQPLTSAIPPEGLPAALVTRYGAQIAAALGHAHDRGIIHRDVKSANIVITPSGQVKVLDFGLARRLRDDEIEEATRSRESQSGTTAIAGTLSYMAPEILRGQEAEARSDIWALGVVLHEMAAGQRPFRGHTGYELSSVILREPPAPLPSSVPAGLRMVIERCLEKEPGHRYQRVGEVQAALEAARPDVSTSKAISADAVATRPSAPRRMRHPIAWTAGSLIAVLFVVLVALDIGGLRDRFAKPKGIGRIQSLAVLPLENLSGDPSQDYFADGMTDELITGLGKISALRVISRTSVMGFKKTRQPLPQIASKLNVDAVLEGSVLRSGDRVRVTVQLIQVADDREIWSERYEGDSQDVLKLQNEVAGAVAQQIRVNLTPDERTRFAKGRLANPDAYEDYLRGRYFWRQFSPATSQKAVDYLQQAIQTDPAYAPAYAGLAECYVMSSLVRGLPPHEEMPKAEAAAKKALALDNTLAEAHFALALVRAFYDLDWSSADVEFRESLSLNANDPETHHFYSHYFMALGRADDSLVESKHALELDPLSADLLWHMGWYYYYTRDYDQAIRAVNRSLDMDPISARAHLYLGLAYEGKRQYAQAAEEFQKANSLAHGGPFALDRLAHTYAISGRKDEALKIVRQLADQSKTRYISGYGLALVFVGLNDRAQALTWLEKAYEERSWGLSTLKVDPLLDPLRSEPRFQEILRMAGLAPASTAN